MLTRFTTLLALAAAGVLLLLAGCAAADGESGDAIYEGDSFVIQPVTAETIPDRVRETASDIVVVNFWASWCAPCREEFPDFIRYDGEHADVAVRFVSVDVMDDLDFAVTFLEEEGVSGTTYMRIGEEQSFFTDVSEEWVYAGIPATAIYDRDGQQLDFWQGKVDYMTLAQRVAAVQSPS